MKLPLSNRTLAALLAATWLSSCGSPEAVSAPVAPDEVPAVHEVPPTHAKNENSPPADSDSELNRLAAARQVAQSLNSFGLDLHRVLAAENPKGNLLTSPYALGSGLAMLSCGAEGATLREFEQVLHLPQEEIMLRGFGELNRRFQPDQPKPDANGRVRPFFNPVSLATRLYGQKDLTFKTDFLGKLRTSFRSDLEAVDFVHEPDAVREHINKWVSVKTDGHIETLLPESAITPLTRLQLITALRFADQWLDTFDPEMTKPASFHLFGGKEVMVATMFKEEHFYYHIGDGFKAVELPFLGDIACRFILCVPDAKEGLQAMEGKFIQSIFTNPKAFGNDGRGVLLYLPKFTFQNSSQSLSKPLKKLGLNAPFDVQKSKGAFPRISGQDSQLFLSEIYQQTFIRVYEKGTEASAGYGIGMTGAESLAKPPPPLEIRADRPFLFAIQEIKTGALLFLGRVTDPR